MSLFVRLLPAMHESSMKPFRGVFTASHTLLQMLKEYFFFHIQKFAKLRIFFTQCVCNEVIFNGLQFLCNRLHTSFGYFASKLAIQPSKMAICRFKK